MSKARLVGKLIAIGEILSIALPATGFGWQVKGRPTLPSDCRSGETWVTDHTKETGSWTAFCRKVPSGKKTNSKTLAYWGLKFKSGRPPNWPFLDERESTWQTKDVKDVLGILEKTPTELWDSSLEGIYRMNRSKDYPNPGATWKNVIVLYDSAFQNGGYLRKVLIHELAHRKFRNLSETERTGYAKYVGWKVIRRKNGDLEFKAPNCCFIKADDSYSIDEDFANSVEYFLVDPAILKKKKQKAYAWIKNHFGSKFIEGLK